MKLRAVLTAVFVAGLVVSLAVAAPPPGKGKGKAAETGAACKPVVTFVLKGEYVSGSADAEGAGSFVMDVKQANAHGRQLRGEEATIHVDAKTRIRRRGHAELADLEAGDRLNVHVRSCKKAAESAGTTGAAAASKLLAKQVIAQPAKAAEDGEPAASA